MNTFKFIAGLSTLCTATIASAIHVDAWQRFQDDLIKAEKHRVVLENAQNGGGSFVTVGPGGACDFDSSVLATPIQDAIDSGAPEVRLATSIYNEAIEINDISVSVRSGFANCTDADNNLQTPLSMATLNAVGLNRPVVYITGSSERHLVSLENLNLTGGVAAANPTVGGGLSSVDADVELHLELVAITGNRANSGGGIGIDNGNTELIGRHVAVIGNLASVSGGGGLICSNPGNSLMLYGFASVSENVVPDTAPFGHGGGVRIAASCSLSMYPDMHPDWTMELPGIHNNSARANGGGIYASPVARVFLFGRRMCDNGDCLGSNQLPVFIRGNEAGTDPMGEFDGGGVYLADNDAAGASLYANGLFLDINSSDGDGGGAYVEPNASLIIERGGAGCWHPRYCNYLGGNRAGTNAGLGGAIYSEGAVDVSNALITENRADFGTVLFATGAAADVRMESVLIVDNGENGGAGYADNHVIHTGTDATTALVHATVADNQSAPSVFNIEPLGSNSLSLHSSIVHDALSGPVLAAAQGALDIDCVMAHETASFAGTRVVQDDPQFVVMFGDEYVLNPITSPAIDFCDDAVANVQHNDLNGDVRGWDDPTHANVHGPFDLGADEQLFNDVIFKDGFDGF